MVSASASAADWVLLSYHIPREPSTPRIAVWRKLKQLGVAQLGDGLVALPHNPRTLEHLEWIAEQVLEADGHAVVWSASPTLRRDGLELADELSDARTLEYQELANEVRGASTAETRSIKKWRRAWRSIEKRDYFGADGRDACRHAIDDAAKSVSEVATR